MTRHLLNGTKTSSRIRCRAPRIQRCSYGARSPGVSQAVRTPCTCRCDVSVVPKPSYGHGGVGGKELDAGSCYPLCVTGYHGYPKKRVVPNAEENGSDDRQCWVKTWG